MGTSVRDGDPRRLTPAPAQSAVQTAFLFATIECAGPLPAALCQTLPLFHVTPIGHKVLQAVLLAGECADAANLGAAEA